VDATDRLLANSLLMWTILEDRQEQLREADAAKSWGGRLGVGAEQKKLAYEAFLLKRGMLKILHDPARLDALRPYLPGAAEIEPWMLPSLIRLLPPGVAAEAISQARKAEDHPRAVPYFDPFEAEADLLGGEYAEALTLARQALDQLPDRQERLLRGRAAAVAGEAARRLGKTEECLALWNQALQDFPEAFRLLHLALPVRVEPDGSPLAQLTAQRLLNSPRFQAHPAGFRILIRMSDGALKVEMLRAGDEQHFELSVPAGPDAEQVVAAALEKCHFCLMSPSFELSVININSLDRILSAQTREEMNAALNMGLPK
jgi:tetratricopeptide (TPR) repeat protein